MSDSLLIRTAARWGIPRPLALAVIERDDCCIYCRTPFAAPYLVRATCPSWEHIVNDLTLVGADNIGLCCVSCNASKGAKTLGNWLTSAYCQRLSISRTSIAAVAAETLAKN